MSGFVTKKGLFSRRSSKYLSVNMHECKINHLEQPPGNKLVVVLIERWGDLFYETLEWRE